MVVTRAKAARIKAGESEEETEFTPKPSPAKKRKVAPEGKTHGIDGKVQSIYDYMAENEEDFASTEVQYMLMTSLPFILGEGSAEDERCEDVKVLVEMVKEKIDSSVERKAAAENEANETVTSAETEEEEANTALQNSQAKVTDHSSKMSEIADALHSDRQAELDAEDAVAKAQQEVEDFDSTQSGVKAELPACDDAIKRFTDLQATDWGKKKEEMKATMWIKSKAKKEMTGHVQILVDYLKLLEAEESLLQTVPHVFTQKAEERGVFGKMAVEKIEEMLNKRREEIQNRINNAESLKQEVLAAVSVAEEKLEEAKKNRKDKEKDLEQAEETLITIKAEEKEASKTRTEHSRIVKNMTRARDAATKEHQKAQKVLSHLTWLSDRKSTEPEAAGENGDHEEN